ncbi:hypothetical protein ABPG75_002515 [Micractinium tetrahymenae]
MEAAACLSCIAPLRSPILPSLSPPRPRRQHISLRKQRASGGTAVYSPKLLERLWDCKAKTVELEAQQAQVAAAGMRSASRERLTPGTRAVLCTTRLLQPDGISIAIESVQPGMRLVGGRPGADGKLPSVEALAVELQLGGPAPLAPPAAPLLQRGRHHRGRAARRL